jgi:Activator of Hsp90 ATPase homolog 1-like protein
MRRPAGWTSAGPACASAAAGAWPGSCPAGGLLDDHARESDLPAGSTRVVVLLEAQDGGSRLTLQHHELPTDELREGHRVVAWETYLARLAVRDAGGPHSGSVGDGARKAES